MPELTKILLVKILNETGINSMINSVIMKFARIFFSIFSCNLYKEKCGWLPTFILCGCRSIAVISSTETCELIIFV